MVIEKAYAKLNLSLNVLNKRIDGFHNLESIMVPVVDLYDTLYFYEREDYEIEILDNNIADNIILKAAKIFQEKYHTKGVTIRLEKRIPIEAGLAGGSADASATLRALNKLFKLNLSLFELEPLALSLGSDTVFCLYNKAALCKGRGEILEFIDFDFAIDLCILKPNFGLLTKDVFNNRTLNDTTADSLAIINALRKNDIEKVNNLISNDLYYAAIKVEPKLQYIVDTLYKNNIDIHMSGSGSSLFVFSGLLEKSSVCLSEVLLANNIEYNYLGQHKIKNVVNDW